MTGENKLVIHHETPFFDRVFSEASRAGLISASQMQTFQSDGAKSILQIAKFFGSANLRPALEDARARFVTLMSLYLEVQSEGQIEDAIPLLLEHSLVRLSKRGADLLRGLMKMPINDVIEPHFYDEITLLDEWTRLHPYRRAEYLLDLELRQPFRRRHALAQAVIRRFGLDAQNEIFEGKTTNQILNSAFLSLLNTNYPTRFETQVERDTWITFGHSVLPESHDLSLRFREYFDCSQDITEEVISFGELMTGDRVERNHGKHWFSGAASLELIDPSQDNRSDQLCSKLGFPEASFDRRVLTHLLRVFMGFPGCKKLSMREANQVLKRRVSMKKKEKADATKFIADYVENNFPPHEVERVNRLWEELTSQLDHESKFSPEDDALELLQDMCIVDWESK